jgi:small nuclear ribonucleoprotein (snRNP)-like protein
VGVQRFDTGKMGRAERRPDGSIRVPAHIAKVGVQTYRFADGRVRREYRPASEVFHADALRSFELVPLTDNHPGERVTTENTKRYQVGATGSNARADGRLVAMDVVVNSADTIRKVEAGKVQLSGGYTCDMDETPGEFEGERYDAIQRNIRGNHVAIVDVGRAGPDVRMHLDAGDAEQVEDAELSASARNDLPESKFAAAGGKLPIHDEAHVRAAMSRFGQTDFADPADRAAAARKIISAAKRYGIDCSGFEEKYGGKSDAYDPDENSMSDDSSSDDDSDSDSDSDEDKEDSMKTIKIRGIEFKVDDAVAQAIEAEQADHQKRFDGERGRADALESKLKESEKMRTDASDSFPKAVAARVVLERKAHAVLGSAEKLDALTDREVKVKVLAKLDAEFKADGVSDAYVDGAFAVATKKIVEIERARAAVEDDADDADDEAGGDHEDGAGGEEAARARMIKRNGAHWKKNTIYSEEK